MGTPRRWVSAALALRAMARAAAALTPSAWVFGALAFITLSPMAVAGRDAANHAAVIKELIARGTADSLATAALFTQFGAESDLGGYSLIQRAIQLAPERRDLAWLAVQLCSSARACDEREPEKHMREVDPANGIGSTGALSRAQRKNDIAGVDAALTDMGSSERFYVYFAPLVGATATELLQLKHHGTVPPRRARADATMEMAGVLAASVLPPWQSFLTACKGLALEQVAGRLERCRRAAEIASRADTYLVEGLGLSLQQQLWPLDSPEGRAITAQRRVLQYRLEEYSRLDISSAKIDEFPADALDQFRAHEREQDVALVYFARAGVAPEPPAGWTSHSLPRVP